MTGFISSLPESDPRRIFWRQEDSIHSIVEYVALLVAITKRSPMEMDEDEQSGCIGSSWRYRTMPCLSGRRSRLSRRKPPDRHHRGNGPPVRRRVWFWHRIYFIWTDGGAKDVEFVDYH